MTFGPASATWISISHNVKRRAQAFLKRVGLYQRIKFSCLYDLYWRFKYPRWIHQRTKEVEFFRQTLKGLQSGMLIFDIGANHGQKTDVFLRLGARVVAIDPDPSNQEILKQSFLKYRLAPKPVVIVGKAVSDHRGKETMWVEQPGSAMNTLNPKWVDTLRHDPSRFGTRLDFGAKQEVETITLEELIQSHGTPLYVKIDVEGYEASVLRGLRTAVPFVSFEVNLPEFKPEAVQCVELLERVAANGVFNYTADCVQGLVLERWLPATAFLGYLDSCEDPCIEIFWDSTGGSEGIPSSVTVRQSVHGAESTRRTGC